MAENALVPPSEDQLGHAEQRAPASITPNYPDPLLANLEFTDACYARTDESITLPKLHVMNSYHFDIYGVDTIWHNMYRGPNSDFETFRIQYDCSIEQAVQMVAQHVAQGLYGIISMTATKHTLTVICGCEKKKADMPPDMWNDPLDMPKYPWKRPGQD